MRRRWNVSPHARAYGEGELVGGPCSSMQRRCSVSPPPQARGGLQITYYEQHSCPCPCFVLVHIYGWTYFPPKFLQSKGALLQGTHLFFLTLEGNMNSSHLPGPGTKTLLISNNTLIQTTKKWFRCCMYCITCILLSRHHPYCIFS
jgi:hypothetical protein